MEIRDIVRQFAIEGELVTAETNHEGHINGTYICTFSDGAMYTVQQINRTVFVHPEQVMENIELVTSHIRSRLTGTADMDRRCLTVIRTKEGNLCFKDDTGEYWRV
ncbi:MAG: aminoglycoside phosphotransferase family protein, partial [Sphaerochaeta sp.]|nr:aminoglycoside phosphotransferase family protein [Sphaerochaeta sp.]